jgi:S1-C subfamily serine protease
MSMNHVEKFALLAAATFLVQCGSGNGPGPDNPKGTCAVENALERVSPSVVRVIHEQGSGSGFVVEADRTHALIVTNYHVVQPGQNFMVEFHREGAEPMKIGGVEVVKTDIGHDLAVLSVPTMNLGLSPIRIDSEPRKLGQSIGVIGFPGVEGADTIRTFERGEITALKREMKVGSGHNSVSTGKTWFVQTNANINFGNSGGPVINSCGEAIGVVAAKHQSTERTGLFVPAEFVPQLVAKAKKPRESREGAVRAQIQKHLDSIRFKEGYEAADYTSRGFQLSLHEIVKQKFFESLQQINDMGMREDPPINVWPAEERVNYLVAHIQSLDPMGQSATMIELARQVDPSVTDYDVGRIFYALWISLGIFDVASYKVERVSVTDDRHAKAFVQVATGQGAQTKNFVYELEHEWGDWVIADYDER